ncbi:MAG: glycosyltransferase [Anaeromyxobacter sp.]
MILAIDGVGAKHGGAATVLLEVLGAALRHGAADVLLFCSPAGLRRFALPTDPRLHVREVSLGERGPGGRILWHRRGVAAALRRHPADAVVFLSGGGVAPRGLRAVTFIQQSLPFCPEALARLGWAGRLRFRAIRQEMAASVRHAAEVVVQTPTMQAWVESAFQLAPGKVRVLPPGPPGLLPTASPSAVAAAMARVPPDRRLLYVGNDSPYKNLEVLVRALRRIREQWPETTLFATVGGDHPMTREPGVIGLSYLQGGELRAAYEGATALVLPSLVETVGLPLLEASGCGTPVVVADRPYAHDVCSDAAAYFDPLDPDALVKALLRVLGDPNLRRRLGGCGRELAQARSGGRPYDRLVELALVPPAQT